MLVLHVFFFSGKNLPWLQTISLFFSLRLPQVNFLSEPCTLKCLLDQLFDWIEMLYAVFIYRGSDDGCRVVLERS